MTGQACDVLVVGAGFAGSVCASDGGGVELRVLVIGRRPHIAGNAHDAVDRHGILCHSCGAHILHTNAPAVVQFLSRFTEWQPYEHRVRADADGSFVPMPVNRTTIETLHDVHPCDDADVAAHLSFVAEDAGSRSTSEGVVISKATRTSKSSRLDRAPSPANGTPSTRTPCSGQRSRRNRA